MSLFQFIPTQIKRKPGLILTLATAILLCSGLTARGQEDVLTTETSLVQLNVGVVNKQGNHILNLSKNDFSIFEDGAKQKIQFFEPTEAPFSVVMLLDMSG